MNRILLHIIAVALLSAIILSSCLSMRTGATDTRHSPDKGYTPYIEILLDSLYAQDERVKAMNMEIDSLNRRPVVVAEADGAYEVPFVSHLYIPRYPGGIEELGLFLSRNLKYPQAVLDSCIQGKVTVRFEIERDGSLINEMITEGFHTACDAEVVRVIRMMPKWIPAPARGKSLSRHCVLSVIFGLSE